MEGGVPDFGVGVGDASCEAGGEGGVAGFADGVEDGGGETAVDASAVDCCGDVEAGADFALGCTVGCLG